MKAPQHHSKAEVYSGVRGPQSRQTGFSISDEVLSSLDAIRQHIINNGHIAHEGSAQEIKARPQILHRHLGV
jgi:ABC-type lipopolysaccharide export system ATPase subunit